jgi:hypothetical protein
MGIYHEAHGEHEEGELPSTYSSVRVPVFGSPSTVASAVMARRIGLPDVVLHLRSSMFAFLRIGPLTV